MKKNFFFGITAAVIITVVPGIACKKNDQAFPPRGTQAGLLAEDPCGCTDENGQYSDTIDLPTTITSNMTLTCDKLWLLDGKTYVINNAKLTIDGGTRIEGVKAANPSNAAALIITRGADIFAEGSVECPIVFTSHETVKQPGDWGGVVILGSASLNRSDTTIEGIDLPTLPVGVNVNYGGGGFCLGNDADNSGILRFVRIEYGGVVLGEGNELNGLTLGGVGSGTTLSHIQVAYGADDGFEFFGGTVKADHLISYGNNEDDFDFDFGYGGTIQFAVGSKMPDVAYAFANANGIESDNNQFGVPGFPPGTCKRTNPLLTNLTLIGSDANCSPVIKAGLFNGALFRTNSSYRFRNSIIMDYPIGLHLQSVPTQGDENNFAYNLVHGYLDADLASSPTPGVPFDVSPNPNNTFIGLCSSPNFANATMKLVSPYTAEPGTPNYTLQATSPALTGANFTGLTGVTVTTYRGAFGTTNWTSGWTRWNF